MGLYCCQPKLVVFATYKTIEKSKQGTCMDGGGDQNNGVRLHMGHDEQNENQNGKW
jgi:hypothetical protein